MRGIGRKAAVGVRLVWAGTATRACFRAGRPKPGSKGAARFGGWISYDPELDLIYYGTSNPSPWNEKVRPGDNKFTAGIFARYPDKGAARWFYQLSPHDLFDHDGVNENILLDIAIDGQPRKVLVRPERNGMIYVIDRVSGKCFPQIPSRPRMPAKASI
ncbi:hypothetical protein ACFPL7_13435 [Dongia soli]|uniref:Pyrrolo-quinoline quinone repeat domain-containing protein n=1 Tax=Dongia soli TaxID=600628 RepID=A0ABU5ED36_9PROT|nr:hypothetical protein [Dongia soli]MDY0884096.1 hypothetical protein [Dongia soli]